MEHLLHGHKMVAIHARVSARVVMSKVRLKDVHKKIVDRKGIP